MTVYSLSGEIVGRNLLDNESETERKCEGVAVCMTKKSVQVCVHREQKKKKKKRESVQSLDFHS